MSLEPTELFVKKQRCPNNKSEGKGEVNLYLDGPSQKDLDFRSPLGFHKTFFTVCESSYVT